MIKKNWALHKRKKKDPPQNKKPKTQNPPSLAVHLCFLLHVDAGVCFCHHPSPLF